jgi:hypothetical protein
MIARFLLLLLPFLGAASLSGCFPSAPYVASETFTPPRNVAPEARRRQTSPCYAQIRSVVDKRSDPSTFGSIEGREVRPPANVVTWLTSALHGIDQFGVNSAPPDRSELESTQIEVELLVAWVSEVRVSKTANIVLQVRYRRAGVDSDPKIFRGATNSPAWTGSDEAMQQMLDEAMIKIVKGVAADIVEGCKSPRTH